MPRKSRPLTQRIRDQLGFSLVAVLVIFLVLRVLGVRATVSALFLSLLLTIGLNVGLSYWYEHRARREQRRGGPAGRAPRGGGDIRWRDEDSYDAHAARDSRDVREPRRRP